MARLKKNRLIQRSPSFEGFAPVGAQAASAQSILLTLEEYEAFTLCDYEQLNHAEAAILMGISRPTFTRVYGSARTKIATAFVEAAAIRIEGGNASISTRWYHCHDCGVDFNLGPKQQVACSLCGSKNIKANS